MMTPDNVKSIYWRMSRKFDPGGRDLNFYVDISDESLGDWTTLNPDIPVTDNCVYQDMEQRRYNMVSDIWYRVRLVLSDPEGILEDEEEISVPAQLQGSLSDRAFLLGRAMLSGFYKDLRKGGGQQGFLMKKKIWGDKCPECTGFDLETVINGHCPVCYGTGIVGGYYEGIEFWIKPSTVQSRARTESPIGTMDDYSITAECAAYPWIDADDIWMDAKTGERFLVKAISHVSELERKPIILKLQLDRLAATDISREIPVVQTAPPEDPEVFETEDYNSGETEPLTEKFPVADTDVVKSDIASEDRGWRRGLNTEDW